MGDENDAANYVYDQLQVYLCPSWALSLGYMGVAAGACLSNWGSAVSCFFNLTVWVLGRQCHFWHGICCLKAVTEKIKLSLSSWCCSDDYLGRGAPIFPVMPRFPLPGIGDLFWAVSSQYIDQHVINAAGHQDADRMSYFHQLIFVNSIISLFFTVYFPTEKNNTHLVNNLCPSR